MIASLSEHRSASRRREEAATAECDFFKAVAAALIVRDGGVVTLPGAALDVPCRLEMSRSDDLLTLKVVALVTPTEN